MIEDVVPGDVSSPVQGLGKGPGLTLPRELADVLGLLALVSGFD